MEIIRLLDIRLFYFVNHALKSVLLDFLMVLVTELGSSRFACGIGIICLFSRKREIKLTGVFLLAAAFFSINIIEVLKNTFMVPRPFRALKDVYYFTGAAGYAFPSGHTSMAFLSATILSFRLKQRMLLYFLALTVAFSRVYLGVHYPSDVIVGAVIGLAIGYFFVRLYNAALAKNGP